MTYMNTPITAVLILSILLVSCVNRPTYTTSVASPSPTYSNPVLHADYSDPDVIRSGKYFYLISSSFHLSPGLPILRSEDLVNWTIVNHVLPSLPFGPKYDLPGPFRITDYNPRDTSGTRYGGGPWAPTIREHEGRFYAYWGTPDEGIFMATAETPESEWSKPVHLMAQKGLEDPAPFWDDDGKAWMIRCKVGAGPLTLHRMSWDGTKILDDGIVVAEDPERLPVLEGPKLYKRNGYYYIFAPIGGVSTGPQAVGRAEQITGPYTWRKVMVPGGELDLKGPHQGAWIETRDGRGWFMHFNHTGAFGRILHLQPLKWVDNWPVIGEQVKGEQYGLPVARNEYPLPPAREYRLQDSDEFNSDTLGVQWAWNHNPVNSRWSLTERPGFLRLHAGKAQAMTHARNTLTQILNGNEVSYTARLDLKNMADGQRAGLVMFDALPSWVGAVRENGVTTITVSREGKEQPLATTAQTNMLARVEITPSQKARYSYSLDEGDTFSPAGEMIELPPYAWWKGSRPGLFSFNKRTANGSVDIDWFRVNRTSAQ